MTGTIRFDTIPEKANIFIDGNFIDQSPVDISDVNGGKHGYKLSSGGYEDFVSSLTVYDNKITHITVNMQNGTETENFLDYPIDKSIDKGVIDYNVKDRGIIQYEQDEWGQVVPKQDISSIPPEDIPGGLPKKSIEEIMVDSLGEIKSLLQQLLENSNQQTEKNLTGKFDTGIQTLATAVTFVPPEDNVSDTGINGYTRIAVWDVLGRLSQEIYVMNQGPGTIYARKSNDGKTFSAVEIPVFAGEKHTFNDIYEFRIRTDLAGTRYRITEYETNLIINNFDDRVATAAHIFSGINNVGPHGDTVRAIYTVPTGFKAKINGCYVFLEIESPAVVPGRRTLTVQIDNPTIGGLSVMSRSFGSNENIDGDVREAEIGFAYTLLTGESVRLITRDSSTGGSVNYFGSVEITQYFSYPT